METFEYLILSRSLERIIAALLGGAAIFWAYRIFLSLPNVSAVEDNFRFNKYLSYNMFKIGAGTIFLIFGAYIVLATVLKKVTYEKGMDGIAESYSGIGDNKRGNGREQDLIDYNNLSNYFATLNRVPTLLGPEADGRTIRDVELTISRTKLNLMLAIWLDHWGDKVEFREWAIRGANGPKPELVNQMALDLFLTSD